MRVLLLILTGLLCCVPSVWALDESRTAVQALLGYGEYFNDGLTFADDGSDPNLSAEASLGKVPLIGIAGQLPFNQGRTLLGMEAGGLVGWRAKKVTITAGSGGAYIRLESAVTSFDLFFGAFVSRNLGDKFRLYAGAGPTFLFANYDGKTTEYDSAGNPTEIDTTESSFGVGGYLRGGLEFRLPDYALMGLGVRWLKTDLTFDQAIEQTGVSGIQYLLTYTRGF